MASLEMSVHSGILIVDSQRDQPGAAEHRVRALHRGHCSEIMYDAVDIRVKSGSRHRARLPRRGLREVGRPRLRWLGLLSRKWLWVLTIVGRLGDSGAR